MRSINESAFETGECAGHPWHCALLRHDCIRKRAQRQAGPRQGVLAPPSTWRLPDTRLSPFLAADSTPAGAVRMRHSVDFAIGSYCEGMHSVSLRNDARPSATLCIKAEGDEHSTHEESAGICSPPSIHETDFIDQEKAS
jgi:hypothetical protein